VSSFLTAHQHNIGYAVHTIKITKKLSIYNRFKNNRISIWTVFSSKTETIKISTPVITE